MFITMLRIVLLSLVIVTQFHCYVIKTCTDIEGYIPKGDIHPQKDLTLFAGENLTLYCMLNASSTSHNISVKDIYFITRDANKTDRIIDNVVQMPSNNSKLIFKMTDTISEEVLKRNPERLYSNYVCRYKDESALCPIDHKFIRIDYKPRAPRNQSCMVYNWQNMTCIWDLGVIYRHINISVESIHSEYSVDWTVYNMWSACPHPKKEETCFKCTWKMNDGKDTFKKDKYKFRVSLRNDNRNITETYMSGIINSREFVLPKEIESLKASPNKTSIELTWTHSNSIEDKRYRIRVSSEWTKFSEEEIYYDDNDNTCIDPACLENLSVDGKDIRKFILSNLTAYTQYNITVDVIPLINGTPMGFWSKPVTYTVKTLEDVPGSNPKFWRYFYNCHDNHICSNLTIYWQPTSIQERHGVLLNYKITVENVTDHVKSKPLILTDTSVTKYTLHLNDTSDSNIYKIMLSQETKEGKPKDDSYIYIAPEGMRPKPPNVTWVEANETSVDITWDAMDKIEFYGVVWCKGTIQTGCQDTIQTFIVRNKTSYSINMDEFSGSYREYIYGVGTFNHTIQSLAGSEIAWSKCTYVKNGVPDKPLKIKRDNITDEKFYHIEWEPYDCNEAKGYVTNYVFIYCVKNGKQKCTAEDRKEVNVSSEFSSYSLKNEKGNQYLVWVQAQLHNKRRSPLQTEPLEMFVSKPPPPQQKQPPADDHTVKIVGGVVGGVIIICIALVLIYCIGKKCRQIERDVQNIDLPTIHVASRSSDNSDDDGYEGSGQSYMDLNKTANKEETQPMLPKKPGDSDSNDSGVQENITDNKTVKFDTDSRTDSGDTSHQWTSSGEVDPYVKQTTDDLSIANSGSEERNNTSDKSTVNFNSNMQKLLEMYGDTSSVDPYVKGTTNSSGENMPSSLSVDKSKQPDNSGDSVISYVRGLPGESDGYVKREESDGSSNGMGYNDVYMMSSGDQDSSDEYFRRQDDNDASLSNIEENFNVYDGSSNQNLEDKEDGGSSNQNLEDKEDGLIKKDVEIR